VGCRLYVQWEVFIWDAFIRDSFILAAVNMFDEMHVCWMQVVCSMGSIHMGCIHMRCRLYVQCDAFI